MSLVGRADVAALPTIAHGAPVTVVTGLSLGEGPVWSPAGELLFVDAERRTVYCAPGGRDARGTVLPGPVAAVAVTRSGGWMVVGGTSVCTVERDGTCAELTSIPDVPAGIRFNDAKAGPDGRLWAGTRAETDRPTGLWALDVAGGAVQRPAAGSFGNGLAWTDMGTFLHVDSGLRAITRYDWNGGDPREPRRHVELAGDIGVPDGLTVDSDGWAWLAVWGAGCVLRLDPDGTPRGRVDLPDRHVSSCEFVGDDFDQLAVTTAADAHRPGALYLLDVGATGVPTRLVGAT